MTRFRSPLVLPAVALFALLAVLYTASIGLPASRSADITGDEPFYLLTTQSLLDDGNFDLREQYERESYRSFFEHPDGLWKQSRTQAGERIVSPHEPGLSVLLVPGFALAGLRGAQAELLVIAAATFALAFVLAAKETGRVRTAWLVTATVGLSAPAFVYSTEVYPEIPAAFLLVLGLLAMKMSAGAWRAVALAAIVTGMAWLGMKYLPVAGVLALAYAFTASNRERATFGALAAASAAAYVAGHLALFGALTPYSGNSVYDGAATSAVVESHFSFGDRAYRIWGLFVDRRFGIGHWAPLLLLVLPALPLLLRTRTGGVIAALIATQIVVATFLTVTMMGWWFPGRQLIVVFPLMAIALTALVTELPTKLAALWFALGAWTLSITAALALAGHREKLHLAVDPFELDSPVFAAANSLFPDYRSWTLETQALNAAWVLLLAAATALVVRGRFRMPAVPTASLWKKSARKSGSHLPGVGSEG